MVAGHTVWLFLPLDRENLSSGYQESCFLTFLTWNIVTGKMTSEIVFILTTKQTNKLSFFFLKNFRIFVVWTRSCINLKNQVTEKNITSNFSSDTFYEHFTIALFNSKFFFSLNEISEISWLKLNTAMTFVWLIVHYKIMKLDLLVFWKEMTHLQLIYYKRKITLMWRFGNYKWQYLYIHVSFKDGIQCWNEMTAEKKSNNQIQHFNIWR